MASPQFSVEAILEIQEAWDNRTINVRAVANLYDVTPETIRRIGRRDSYRHVGRVTPPQDHRTVGLTIPNKAVSDVEVQSSLEKLRGLLGKTPIKNPMDGGLEDPGEGTVLS